MFVPKLRYLAQRVGTNVWLDYDLRLEVDGPPHCHTTYEVMTGTIAPELARAKADDGLLLLLRWGTWIHVETPDERTWTGIVEEVWAEGETMHVSIREWQGWLEGNTFKGRIWGVEADPADLVRDLWTQMQLIPTGNLGVSVVGVVPNVRLGSKWDDVVIASKYRVQAAKDALAPYEAARKAIEDDIKKITATHDKKIKPKERELLPYQRTYRDQLRVKADDTLLADRKETAAAHRLGKKNDSAIIAYKKQTELKSADSVLRERKWAYDDEADLKKVDPTLQGLKATYDQLREDKASTGAIAAAKAAYDARNQYWNNRIEPFKVSYEERRDYWDALIKPFKRPNEVRVVYWDALINQAERLLQQRVEYWDARLKPYRDAVESRQAVIQELKDARDDELLPFKDQLEDARFNEAPFKEALTEQSDQLKKDEESLKQFGGAYKVLASDRPDSWQILTDLAKAGSFEFTTETVRTNGAPVLRLIIHPGRCGRTRNDLVFEQGRNIIEQPEIREPEEYASEVIGIGAGQGESVEGYGLNLQKTVSVIDEKRLYRNALHIDPSITDPRVLEIDTRNKLKSLRTGPFMPELLVRGIPNCEIGSWSVGDIITPKMSRVPYYGALGRKMRIRSWQRIGADTARLTLEEP